MSAAQQRLPGMDSPRQIVPSSETRAPMFWIRRLRVLRELAPGDEYVLRDVELRRGFNIVWAPPQAAGVDNALFRSGVAGHTAGKSTFCRFLRHVLGEPSFAPEATRRAIRQRLPTAWIVAEVIVNDVAWVVARPLGTGRHSFCIRDGSLDRIAEPIGRLAYEEFVREISASTVDRLAASRFPTNDEPVRWEHVLPWLARDQECRFGDFLEWRHTTSGSEAPSLNVDERQFVVRSVLALISDEERAEQQANARLVAQKKEASQQEPLLRNRAETDHSRISRALGIDPSQPCSPLFASLGRTEINRRMAVVEESERELVASDPRDALLMALEQAVAQEAGVRERLNEARSRLALEKGVLEELLGTAQSSLLASLPPPRDYCNVPMRMAREHGCPLAASRLIELAAVRSERTAEEQLSTQRKVVFGLDGGETRLLGDLETAEVAARNARHAYMSASTAYGERRAQIVREQAALSHLAQQVDDAEQSARLAVEQVDAVDRIDREIKESYSRQEALRDAQQAALGRFSARFDYVVRSILGDEVTGSVNTAGRSLALAVEEHGERESAAIATIKLLAFDLAALVSSIEGDGAFPRFLIHDGPREADLAPDIYERLFLYARDLERCFGGEPSFQYILTTTTRPPDPFVDAPWLRLQLAGTPAEQRLLRCDL